MVWILPHRWIFEMKIKSCTKILKVINVVPAVLSLEKTIDKILSSICWLCILYWVNSHHSWHIINSAPLPPEWALLVWQVTGCSLSVVCKVYGINCFHTQANLTSISAPASATLLLIRISSQCVIFFSWASADSMCHFHEWWRNSRVANMSRDSSFLPITFRSSSSSTSFIGFETRDADWVWGWNVKQIICVPWIQLRKLM